MDDTHLRNLSDVELNVLQRAFLEARFPEVGSDADVWSHPFLIDSHIQVIDEQRRRAKVASDAADLRLLSEWLVWSINSARSDALVRRLADDPRLLDEMRSDRTGLRDLVKPFVMSDEAIDQTLTLATTRDTSGTETTDNSAR